MAPKDKGPTGKDPNSGEGDLERKGYQPYKPNRQGQDDANKGKKPNPNRKR